MRDGIRADIAARVFLTFGALLPYWRLLTFNVIYVTDDYFTSDIFNGELPGRVLVAELMRRHQWPVWTNQLCSGLPLAGFAADPVGLLTFYLLPIAAALDLYVIFLLLVAAHGAYSLARRIGTDRTGAVLAGLAFAGCGYVAAQLKHLGIVSTVVWLPGGLVLLERVTSASTARARRTVFVALFGIVFAIQALSGFVQSAYICALVYGAFGVFRLLRERRALGGLRPAAAILATIGVAALLGGASGAVVLWPLSALGAVSDRAEPLGYVWSTRLAYWPFDALTFLFPYANGDVSNHTYTGPAIFWEDYGYVGILTFLLAAYGAIRERRKPLILFTVAMTLFAYLCVLGRATPAFRIAYELIPGMKLFRFPTRFLIVVELGLAVLGGVGLSRLREDLRRVVKERSRLPAFAAITLCALTGLDLLVHQPRQNPMVPAKDWLTPPAAVAMVRAGTAQPRTFTPRHGELHRLAFELAHGWTNLEPYYVIRDVLQPNTGGGYWDTPSADCYAGIAARWYVDLWGDHNRPGLVMWRMTNLDLNGRTLRTHPHLPTLLRAFGVTHVLSAYAQEGAPLTFVSRAGYAYVYRVAGAERVRFVPVATRVASDAEAADRLLNTEFDPAREILLHDVPASFQLSVPGTNGTGGGSARIASEDSTHLVVDVDAPSDGFLLVADTFFPGWVAEVDNTPAAIYRANLAVRGVAVARGRHQVRLTYSAPGFARGLQVSIAAFAALLAWLGWALYRDRRSSRVPNTAF